MRRWALGSFLLGGAVLASVVYGIWFRRIEYLQILFLLFTALGVVALVIPLVFPRPKLLKNDCYRPFVSLLVPARNEENVIESTIRSLALLRYHKDRRPNFEIAVVDDNSTDQTQAILQRLEGEIPNLRVLHRSPDVAGNGKSAALNDGMAFCQGEVICVFDADSRVDPDFMRNSIPYLFDPKVGGVQAKVCMYNAGTNALTMLQHEEFAVLNHLMQICKDQIHGVTGLGGNGQLTKREALEEVGGWNEQSPTEDFDLTMRMLLAGWEVRYCPEALVYQEGVEDLWHLLRQRFRWAEGLLKCLYDYTWPTLCGKNTLMQKLDGLASLFRIALPMWVIVGYAYWVDSVVRGTLFYSPIPYTAFCAVTGAFFLAMWAGMYQSSRFNFLLGPYRVLRYWLYTSIWVVAVPVGFLKCLTNFRTIHWEKTHHKGSSLIPDLAATPVDYCEKSGALSVVESAE